LTSRTKPVTDLITQPVPNKMKNKHIHPSAKSLALGLVAAAALAAGNSAQAALVFTLTETGSGVTLVGSGSFNFGGTLGLQSAPFDSYLIPQPDLGGLAVGPNIPEFDPISATRNYVESAAAAVVSGPFGFGSGLPLGSATSSTGHTFGFESGEFRTKNVYVPLGYDSGDPLSGESFWSGATLASLGATPGTYTWNTRYGGVDDTITLNVVVPEPSSAAALMGLAALGYGLLRRRRVVKS
jgi:hypothetical protein